MAIVAAQSSASSDSILDSTKKQLGIEATDTDFDEPLIADINTVFTILYQLGVGTTTPFSITDNTMVWHDFIGDNKNIYGVKTYMYMKVRMMFDPPTSSTVLNAMKQQIDELESRLNYFCDPTEDEIASWDDVTTTPSDGGI